jgi:hydroxymethylpyrimidine/phosphomethylpyrimidine kinase
VACVAELVADLDRVVPIVVDPVCVSKHGDRLIDQQAVGALRTTLLPYATVVTPNRDEAAVLTGRSVETPAYVLADLLLACGAEWVLIKGGHGDGDAIDYLKSRDGRDFTYTAARDDTCTRTEPAARWPRPGQPACARPTVPEAMELAKSYVTGAIAAGFALGSGIGPTDHLWQLRNHLPPSMRDRPMAGGTLGV